MVIVIYADQVSQLLMTSQAGSLTCHAFLCTSVAKEAVRIIVDEVVTGLVEYSSGMSLSNSESDSVSETLTQRTGRDLDARGIVGFRMARSDTVDLLEELISN